MPVMSGLKGSPIQMPWWLQIAAGAVDIVFPAAAWLDPALSLAYEAWVLIPWFHKLGALIEMRHAVRGSFLMDHQSSIEGWASRWKSICPGPCKKEIGP